MKPAKGNPNRKRRPNVAPDSKIWIALDHEDGTVMGHLLCRDGKPIGFVRERGAFGFAVAAMLSHEPWKLSQGKPLSNVPSSRQIDDLRRCTAHGEYINFPWFVFHCAYLPLDDRGEIEWGRDFDYATITTISYHGARMCQMGTHRTFSDQFLPSWFVELRKKAQKKSPSSRSHTAMLGGNGEKAKARKAA